MWLTIRDVTTFLFLVSGALAPHFIESRYRLEDYGYSKDAEAYSSNKVLFPEDVVVFAFE